MTMRFVAKFYPNTEKEAKEAAKALEEVRGALRGKVAYSIEHVPVTRTTEVSVHSDGASGHTTFQQEVVKLDLHLHFRDDAFPEPKKEGDADA